MLKKSDCIDLTSEADRRVLVADAAQKLTASMQILFDEIGVSSKATNAGHALAGSDGIIENSVLLERFQQTPEMLNATCVALLREVKSGIVRKHGEGKGLTYLRCVPFDSTLAVSDSVFLPADCRPVFMFSNGYFAVQAGVDHDDPERACFTVAINVSRYN